MRKLATLFLLLFGLSAAPAVAANEILDGLTFRGDIGPKGEAADGKDDIIFTNGTLRSTACDKYGFGPGAYTAVRNGDVVTFTATTKSKTSGTIHWQGTIRDGVLEGTFACKQTLSTKNYWIKAKKQ
jgi:hypothetical protein